MNRKRLKKMAKFLKGLKPTKFELRSIVEKVKNSDLELNDDSDNYSCEMKIKCPSVACAIGWMPTIFPKSGLKLYMDIPRDRLDYDYSGPSFNGCYAFLIDTNENDLTSVEKNDFFIAAEFLDISYDAAAILFHANYYGVKRGSKTVAARIEKLLSMNEQDFITKYRQGI